MKLVSSSILFSVLAFTTFANAGLIEKGCYGAIDKKYGPYIVEVSILSDEVTVSYKSSKYGGLGGYRGRYFTSNFKQTPQSVSVANITLNDGDDGFLDNVRVEITENTVTFDSKNSKDGPQQKVNCLK